MLEAVRLCSGPVHPRASPRAIRGTPRAGDLVRDSVTLDNKPRAAARRV